MRRFVLVEEAGRRLALALALFALLPWSTAAQETPQGLDEIRFEHLTNLDGLSEMTVFAILQDRRGFLWIGTLAGLNRYDGHRFVTYRQDPGDPDSLANEWIEVLHEDRSGNLWIGTAGGLDLFDPSRERFLHYRPDPSDPHSLSHPHVLSIYADHDGILWIGTSGGGLNRFDPATQRFSHYRHDPGDPDSLAHDFVNTVTEDRSRNLWIGTESGLSRFDRATERFTRFRHDDDDPKSLSHDNVTFLYEDRSRRLWIATWGGLDRFDPATRRFHHYRHDPAVTTSLSHDEAINIVEDRGGLLWIGTRDGGLNRLDPATGHFRSYRHEARDPSSLSADFVSALYEDRSGALWIGTVFSGLNRFDPSRQRFRPVRHDPDDPQSLGAEAVNAIHEDRAGNLWIGTWGGGLDRLVRSSGAQGGLSFVHYRHDPEDPTSLGADHIWAMTEDRAGNLWICTWSNGLDRLGPDRKTFHHYRHDPGDPASLGHDEVIALLEDRGGTLWIGTWDGGLDRLDRPEKGLPDQDLRFTHYRHDPLDPSSLSRDVVGTLLEDTRGSLWVGTWGGLDRLDERSGKAGFTHFRHDPEDPRSLSHDQVITLYEDRSGAIWIGTQGGLDRYDPATERLTRFAEDVRLLSHGVHGILEDDLGQLWLSSGRGLVRLDPTTGLWTHFDVGDGLQDIEFLRGSACRGADGTLYFGGIHGLNAFRPAGDRRRGSPPPIVLTSFQLFEHEADLGRSITDLGAIELTHRENFFALEFAALSFTRPDKNRYAYMLEGLDPDWVEPSSRHRASYTGVPPGKYVFRVKGSSYDGVWNEEGAVLEITISPPFWKTWWAYALYVIGAGALAGGFVRSQQHKVEKKGRELAERERLIVELRERNEELARFNYTISHDLRNPLVTIRNFLGAARQDAQRGDQDRLVVDLGHIDRAAAKMSKLLEELLELSRIGRVASTLVEVSIGDLVLEALDTNRFQIEERRVSVRVAADLPKIVGDRVRLSQVIENLITNALKFLDDESDPWIEVGIREDGTEQVIFVADNGSGVEPRYHEKIFGLFERLDLSIEGTGIGLALARRVVEVHGGRIWVESEGPGTGSTFCFTLPAGPAEEARGES